MTGRVAKRRARARAAWRSLAVVGTVAAGIGVLSTWDRALRAQSGAHGLVQPPPAAEPNAAISGVVVDGTTGAPVASALVSLEPASGVVRFGRQIADERGRFVFEGLRPAENYRLTAERFGYFGGRFGRETPLDDGRSIALAEGEWRRDAIVRLWRPAAIGGRVTDEAGEPVVGAWVRAYRLVFSAGYPYLAEAGLVQTDDRGQYRIAGLAGGRFLMAVLSVQSAVPAETPLATRAGLSEAELADAEASGYAERSRGRPAIPVAGGYELIAAAYPTPPPVAAGRPRVYPMTFSPASTTVAGASTIEVGYGEDRLGVDVRLVPVPTAQVSGIVEGGSPAAVNNLTVRLIPIDREGTGPGAETATSLVRSDGRFLFPAVPAGQYVVVAARRFSHYTTGISLPQVPRAPGEKVAGGSGDSVGRSTAQMSSVPTGPSARTVLMQGDDVFGRAAVTVSDADVSNVRVRLEESGAITGRIEWEAGSPPAERVTVLLTAEPAHGEPWLLMPLRLPPRPGGNRDFTLAGLRPGAYRLWTTAQVKSIVWNGRDYTEAPFEITPGFVADNVIVTLTTAEARLSGTIRTPDGQPAERAIVLAFPQERDQWTGYGTTSSRIRAIADGDGTYNIRVPAGRYFLLAVDPVHRDDWRDPAFLAAAAARASRVSVDWDETVTTALVVRDVP